jgi:hypothetical protein
MSQVPATEDAKSPDPNTVSVFELMNKLEREAEQKVTTMHQQSINNGSTLIGDMKKTGETMGDALLQIMEQGAKEFKQVTGRNMTYSQMRQMYG